MTAPVSLAAIKARKASLVSGLIGMTEAERDALVELACEAMTRRPIADTPAPQPPATDPHEPNDEQRSRADKAEAERDAALAALRAQGEIRLDIRGASDLRLRVGVLLQLHWKNLTNEQLLAIKAICDEALGEK